MNQLVILVLQAVYVLTCILYSCICANTTPRSINSNISTNITSTKVTLIVTVLVQLVINSNNKQTYTTNKIVLRNVQSSCSSV